MKLYLTRSMSRFSRRQKLSNRSLREAIERAERGLIDADLGDGLIKQRVARSGQGRSGGYRMLTAYRVRYRAVFLYGFAKSERENIGEDELLTLRDVAALWLSADDERLGNALADGALEEIGNDA